MVKWFIAVLLLLMPAVGWGAVETFYVCKDTTACNAPVGESGWVGGSDSCDPCTSKGAPYLTIAEVFNEEDLNAGDTIIIGAGTYYEPIAPGVSVSGSAGNPITIQGIMTGSSWNTIIYPYEGSTGWTASAFGTNTFENTINSKVYGVVIEDAAGVPHKLLRFCASDEYTGTKGYCNNQEYYFNKAADDVGWCNSQCAPADYNEFGQCPKPWCSEWFDGIEAQFYSTTTKTYIRFRDGEDPDSFTDCPNYTANGDTCILINTSTGGSVDLSGNDYITIENLEIRAGEYGYLDSAASQNNILTGNNIVLGMEKVRSYGATNTISDNTVTEQMYASYVTPSLVNGAWECRLSTDITKCTDVSEKNEHLYRVYKLLAIGDSSVSTGLEGYGITVRGDNTTVSGNTAHDLFSSFSSRKDGATITNNTFYNNVSVGMYAKGDFNVGTTFDSNTVYNTNINFRLGSMDGTSGAPIFDIDLINNKFWLPDGIGEHVYFHAEGGKAKTSYGHIDFAHNSFSGGKYAIDTSTTIINSPYSSYQLTNTHFVNNIFSSRWASNGYVTQVAYGMCNNNWFGNPSGLQTDSCANGTDNDIGSSLFSGWSLSTLHNFDVTGSTAVDAAKDVSDTFYSHTALTGYSSNYWEGKGTGPDMGAVESGGGCSADEDPPTCTGFVSCIADGESSITLIWTDNCTDTSCDGIQTYEVWYNDSQPVSNPPAPLARDICKRGCLSDDATETYTHTSLQSGTLYYYGLIAVDNGDPRNKSTVVRCEETTDAAVQPNEIVAKKTAQAIAVDGSCAEYGNATSYPISPAEWKVGTSAAEDGTIKALWSDVDGQVCFCVTSTDTYLSAVDEGATDQAVYSRSDAVGWRLGQYDGFVRTSLDTDDDYQGMCSITATIGDRNNYYDAYAGGAWDGEWTCAASLDGGNINDTADDSGFTIEFCIPEGDLDYDVDTAFDGSFDDGDNFQVGITLENDCDAAVPCSAQAGYAMYSSAGAVIEDFDNPSKWSELKLSDTYEDATPPAAMNIPTVDTETTTGFTIHWDASECADVGTGDSVGKTCWLLENGLLEFIDTDCSAELKAITGKTPGSSYSYNTVCIDGAGIPSAISPDLLATTLNTSSDITIQFHSEYVNASPPDITAAFSIDDWIDNSDCIVGNEYDCCSAAHPDASNNCHVEFTDTGFSGTEIKAYVMWNPTAIYMAVESDDTDLWSPVAANDSEIYFYDSIEWFINYSGTCEAPGSSQYYMPEGSVHLIVDLLEQIWDGKGNDVTPEIIDNSWDCTTCTYDVEILGGGTVNNYTADASGFVIKVRVPWTEIGHDPSENDTFEVGIAMNDKDGTTESSTYHHHMRGDHRTWFENCLKWTESDIQGVAETTDPTEPTATIAQDSGIPVTITSASTDDNLSGYYLEITKDGTTYYHSTGSTALTWNVLDDANCYNAGVITTACRPFVAEGLTSVCAKGFDIYDNLSTCTAVQELTGSTWKFQGPGITTDADTFKW